MAGQQPTMSMQISALTQSIFICGHVLVLKAVAIVQWERCDCATCISENVANETSISSSADVYLKVGSNASFYIPRPYWLISTTLSVS